MFISNEHDYRQVQKIIKNKKTFELFFFIQDLGAKSTKKNNFRNKIKPWRISDTYNSRKWNILMELHYNSTFLCL
jgi:hypothetical protein